MTTWNLFDGASGRPGVGSSGTQPPASVTPFTGNYGTGTLFKIGSTVWFAGYRWWVATGAPTGPQEFCLSSANRSGAGSNTGTVIPASRVTSTGTFSAGWNTVLLPTPIPLTQKWTYIAATAFACSSGQGFPLTASQWGSGNPYSAGIVNGPLTAFSDQGGSNADPFGCIQSCYQITSSDPTAQFTNVGNGSFLGWLDVQVTDVAPANATYRLFPSLEQYGAGGTPLNYNPPLDTTGYGIGNTFSLSARCALKKIWFLSSSGAAVLPARCGIWDVGTQAEVSGTDNASPSWKTEGGSAASAGGGWCYCDYSGANVVLPSGRNMIVTAWSPGGSLWRSYSIPFWGTGGLAGSAINIGANGLGNGPISAPSTASGTPPQGQFNGPNTAWAYPSSWDAPENDWVDAEVALVASGSGLLMTGATGMGF